MKKNDIALLALIVFFSVAIAYFVGRAVLGGASNTGQAEVEKVDAINPTIASKPDPAIFNKDAINPSVSIKIGDSTKQQPFGQ
jgi:hypothetical protein